MSFVQLTMTLEPMLIYIKKACSNAMDICSMRPTSNRDPPQIATMALEKLWPKSTTNSSHSVRKLMSQQPSSTRVPIWYSYSIYTHISATLLQKRMMDDILTTKSRPCRDTCKLKDSLYCPSPALPSPHRIPELCSST